MRLVSFYLDRTLDIVNRHPVAHQPVHLVPPHLVCHLRHHGTTVNY